MSHKYLSSDNLPELFEFFKFYEWDRNFGFPVISRFRQNPRHSSSAPTEGHDMTKDMPLDDFRAVRRILEPSDFALCGDEPDPPPTDQIDSETWASIMNLPDDVAIRTSGRFPARIARSSGVKV